MDSWARSGSGMGKPRRKKKPPEPKVEPERLEPYPKRCHCCDTRLTDVGGRIDSFTRATGSRAWCSGPCHRKTEGEIDDYRKHSERR